MQTWEHILDAVQHALSGSARGARGARDALQECWDRTGSEDAAQRCVIAHYLADQQDTLEAEIAWDERALAEWCGIAETDLAAIGIASAAGFEPSLHLNLGDAYLRADRVADAHAQLDRARASARHLAGDGYGAMIRAGIQRLGERVEAR